MTDPVLLIDRSKPRLGVLTLNRPAAMNALSWELRTSLLDTLHAWEASREVDVVILTGAGRAFCAGLDLREMSADRRTLDSVASHSPPAVIQAFGGIVIGAINGPAITGGFEVALACDLLIVSEAASFADTHVRAELIPGWGMSQRLSRVIGLYRAKQMSLTGRSISAAQAVAWGLAGEVVPTDALLPAAHALADNLLAMPPAMLRAHKALINDGYGATFDEGMRIEAERSAAYNATVSPDAIAGRRSTIKAG